MITPYLTKPPRTEDEAMFEVWDKRHRIELGKLLAWLYHQDVSAEQWLAVDYAIERLNVAAAERIKEK